MHNSKQERLAHLGHFGYPLFKFLVTGGLVNGLM